MRPPSATTRSCADRATAGAWRAIRWRGRCWPRGESRARHTRRSRRVPATRRDSVRRTASLHGEPARAARTVAGGLCQGRAGAPAGHVHGGRDARGDGPARSRLLGAAGRGAGRPGPAGWRWRGGGCQRRRTASIPPRSSTTSCCSARRADRPAAAGGAGGHRRVSEGRDRGQDGHGRPRSNGPRDRRSSGWSRRCGH